MPLEHNAVGADFDQQKAIAAIGGNHRLLFVIRPAVDQCRFARGPTTVLRNIRPACSGDNSGASAMGCCVASRLASCDAAGANGSRSSALAVYGSISGSLRIHSSTWCQFGVAVFIADV